MSMTVHEAQWSDDDGDDAHCFVHLSNHQLHVASLYTCSTCTYLVNISNVTCDCYIVKAVARQVSK